MREYVTTAVVDEAGGLDVQVKTDLAPGPHRLRLLVDEELTPEQLVMLPVRAELGAFVEDWDDPAMSVYDNLAAADSV